MPDWPTREQWAERTRSAYWDGDSPHPYQASREVSRYASAEEIAVAIIALKKLWADYSRQIKAADDPWDLRIQRSGINLAIKQLRNGSVPGYSGLIPWARLRALPALETILARYEAAVKAGDEKYIAECAARPVDDAAWQNELERRAEIDRWQARGLRAGQRSPMTTRLGHYKFSPDEIARHACLDCGVNVIEAGDYCMLSARIWRDTFGLGWEDNLCVACIEARLGRKLSLKRGDFISFPFVEGYAASDTLLQRYGQNRAKKRKKN